MIGAVVYSKLKVKQTVIQELKYIMEMYDNSYVSVVAGKLTTRPCRSLW